jgi:DNA-binding IclR family transcriptional regulator
MPLISSATGRVYAAFLPRGLTAAMIADELAGPQARRGGLADQAAVDRMLAETRDTGLGRVVGEMLNGVEALCAPVFAHDGRLAGSLTALGTSGAFDSTRDGPVAIGLKAAAGELSQRLGHRPTTPKVMAGLDPAISFRPTESGS